jgi:hypothetical protein
MNQMCKQCCDIVDDGKHYKCHHCVSVETYKLTQAALKEQQYALIQTPCGNYELKKMPVKRKLRAGADTE